MIDGSDIVVMNKCTEIWALFDEMQDEMKSTIKSMKWTIYSNKVCSLLSVYNYALYTSKYEVGRSQPQELLLMILIDLLQDLQDKSY